MIQRTFGHPASAMVRAIEAFARVESADRQNPIMVVENIASTDWASVTFVGQRHVFDLRFEGDNGAVAAVLARLRVGLGELDIPLAGHFVAEIGVDVDGDDADPADIGSGRLRVSALTICD